MITKERNDETNYLDPVMELTFFFSFTFMITFLISCLSFFLQLKRLSVKSNMNIQISFSIASLFFFPYNQENENKDEKLSLSVLNFLWSETVELFTCDVLCDTNEQETVEAWKMKNEIESFMYFQFDNRFNEYSESHHKI